MNPLNITVNNGQSAPPQSIKILKRPASNKKLTDLPNQNSNRYVIAIKKILAEWTFLFKCSFYWSNSSQQPIKTFKQREQEYAQARLRILGSAHAEEEIATTASATISTTVPSNANISSTASTNSAINNSLNITNQSNINNSNYR